MQGLGNDFILLEGADPSAEQVRGLCDRRLGIGADGVLSVDSRPGMVYWNADGSAAEMCGNGLRCVARYSVDRGWSPAGQWFAIATAVGERRALVADTKVTVELGTVKIGGTLSIGGRTFHEASIGNPHAVALVDDPDLVELAREGQAVSSDAAFPEGANVEFVKVEAPDRIRMRVWERGVGETLACGSGIVVAAAVAVGSAPERVRVEVPGGLAEVYFENERAYLSGPAVTVFVGETIEFSGVDAGR